MMKNPRRTFIWYDLLGWWRQRTPQLRALVFLALILGYMSIELWQVERRSRALVREVRQRFQRQETFQQGQFASLLLSLQDSQKQQNEDDKHRHEMMEQLEGIIRQLGHIVDNSDTSTVP